MSSAGALDRHAPQPLAQILPPLEPIAGAGDLAGFRVELDPVSGRPARALGGRLPWLPGAGNALAGAPPSGARRKDELFALARAFVANHADLYRLPDGALVPDRDGTVSLEADELDVVRLALVEDGLPVLGGRLVFVLRFGNLVYFGSSHASAPGEARALEPRSPEPFAAGVALARIAAHAGLAAEELLPAAEARTPRFLLPGSENGLATRRRVRALRFRPSGAVLDWEGWVDEDSGQVLSVFPAETSCSAPGAGATARVTGGVRPARADDPEELRVLPHVDLAGIGFASATGTFEFAGAALSSELAGRYAAINCIACSNPVQAHASSGPTGAIEFGTSLPSQADSQGNGTSTTASRTAYAHVNTARSLAAKWLGVSLDFLDRPVEVQVNGQNACNAFWSGFALRFFESSPECRNTGEIRDVVAHEWGHALDDFDGTAISDSSLSEGAADLLASFLDRDSCIGDSIWLDATLGASDRCQGVRDIDEKAPGLQHSPVVLTLSSNDCRGGVHCLGEIYGQTGWHLVHNLVIGRSYGSGVSLGKAYGTEVAWELAERLYMLSRPIAEAMDPAAAGVSLYDAYLLADQDPFGNHPHAAHINDAFAHHELIEATPVDDGFACSAPPDPAILLTDVTRGVDGEPQVTLWWKDVASSAYRVLRRRAGAERTWTPVGSGVIVDDNRPQYGLLDRSLENGRTYEYMVLAQALPGCESPGASRVTLPTALPELVAGSQRLSDPVPGGDGDGVIEPGEFFELRLDLREALGLAAATGVSASIHSLDPLVRVGAPGTTTYPDVPALGAAPPAAPFTLYVDPLHPCPARISLIAMIDTDQGCAERALGVDLTPAGCSAGQRSEVRFLSAAVEHDDGNATCSDHDRVLDAGEVAELVVRFDNIGAAPASEVEVVLSTPDSSISFPIGSRLALGAPLAPGEAGELRFELLAGDLACSSRIPFGVEVRAPENLRPSLGSFELEAEEDVAASTLAWDFESGAQGWSGDGVWSLSRTRSNPDDSGQAFWSGAAFNQCSALLSPEFSLQAGPGATLTLSTWYELEGRFQAKYWDGVNVYLIDSTATTLLTPVAGRGYDASLGKLVSCETEQPAWCSDTAGRAWASSTFDLGPWAGETVRLALHSSSDNKTNREGFYVDDVVVTSVALTSCDATTCAPDPSCSTPEMQLSQTVGGCQGEPSTIQAHFDYMGLGAFDWQWDFGDGNTELTTVPDAPVEHVYASAGSYVVRLTATRVADPLCSSTATLAVALSPAPIGDAGPDANAPARIGTPGFAGVEYSWSPATGLDDPSLAQPNAFPGATTEYCVLARDAMSGCARSDCTLVKVPLLCGLDADAVRDLGLTSAGGDVLAGWGAIAGAGSYDLYRVTDKADIPATRAVNTSAEKVASVTAPGAVDPGAVSPPPSAPALLFYQAVVRCP